MEFNHKSKFFLFYGKEVNNSNENILQELYQENINMLPLDGIGASLVLKHNIPLITIEDFFSYKDIVEIKNEALIALESWFVTSENKFTLDGICFPKIDREALFWFWYESFIVLRLSEKFKDKEAIIYGNFEFIKPRPSLYYNPSDTAKYLIKSLLPVEPIPTLNKKEVVHTPRSIKKITPKYLYNTLVKNTIKFTGANFFKKDKPRNDYLSLVNSNAFIVNPGEFIRFSDIIKKLKAEYNDSFVLFSISPLNKDEIKGLNIHDPTLMIPAQSENKGIGEFFESGFNELLLSSHTQNWYPILEKLKYHFIYYCNIRWPELNANYNLWKLVFTKYRPNKVLFSGLEDAESILPGLAARKKGIKTFSIPDGNIPGRLLRVQVAEKILCSSELQVQQNIHSGNESDRLVLCKDITLLNEYHTEKYNPEINAAQKKILVLTNPVGYSERFFQAIQTKAQIEAFRIIEKTQYLVKDKAEFLIKPHPWISNLEIIKYACKDLENLVVPNNTNLHEVLNNSDLIVSLNYVGSALFHAFKKNKPVIFLITDLTFGVSEPVLFSDYYYGGGDKVNNYIDFSNLISSFLENQNYADELTKKSKSFERKYLDNKNYKSLMNILREN